LLLMRSHCWSDKLFPNHTHKHRSSIVSAYFDSPYAVAAEVANSPLVAPVIFEFPSHNFQFTVIGFDRAGIPGFYNNRRLPEERGRVTLAARYGWVNGVSRDVL
jgi:hypothetical protein